MDRGKISSPLIYNIQDIKYLFRHRLNNKFGVAEARGDKKEGARNIAKPARRSFEKSGCTSRLYSAFPRRHGSPSCAT